VAPPVSGCDGSSPGQPSQLVVFAATFSWRRGGACFVGLVQAPVRAGLIRCIRKRPVRQRYNSSVDASKPSTDRHTARLCPRHREAATAATWSGV